MTKKEIRNFLVKINHENILNAFQQLDKVEIKAKSLIRQYVIRHKGGVYPPPETLRIAFEIATGNILPEDFFANIGEGSEQFKFIREQGFELNRKMYKYYFKKVSKQDVEKTTVINNEAEYSFFGITIPNRNDSAIITIKYLPDNLIDKNVKLIKKQDIRIFIDRDRIKEGNILLFENTGNGEFTLSVKTSYDSDYLILNSSLKNNYLLTDDLTVNDKAANIVNDPNAEYTKKNMKHQLNQILFGPPGTGKTYSTITKALNIIGLLEEKASYTKEEYEAAQELFQNELGKRIEFVTMHQSFSYEDFVQGLKPRKADDGKGITFDYKNGVFKEICERADESKILLKRNTTEETFLINKLFPSFLLAIDEQSVYDTLSEKKFEGKKITQKFAIEYFNEKLGKKYCKAWRDKFDYVLGNKSPRVGYQADKFRNGELEDFIEYSKAFEILTPEKRKEKLITEWIDDKPETIIGENILNNHVIILDEINRANISRVFGELIALIEKDKRDGKLTATLPSGEPFTVPSNLFIIGTMNTADKSIALVDIALRRRFNFIPLYPNKKILKAVLEENKLDQKEIETRVNLMTNLNKIIRAKKSVDFEIGHSYFMENETLTNILNNQVLPLLNEYFMYDLRKVKEIIEKTQKDKEGNNIPKLGITLNQSIWKDRGLLEVESIDTIDELKEEEELDETDENTTES